MDYAALKTELTTDPNTYGYSQWVTVGSCWKLADLLNKTRAAIRISQKTISVEDFKEAINPTEFAALTAVKRDQLIFMAQGGTVKIKGAGSRAMLDDIFPSATALVTNTALTALRTRDGSRAEQLFGDDVTVSADDVAKALAL